MKALRGVLGEVEVATRIEPEWFLRDCDGEMLRRYIARAGGLDEFLEDCRKDCGVVGKTIDLESLRYAVLRRLEEDNNNTGATDD